MKIEMFDVIQVDLGRSFGSEQGGIRPAVIVQNNKGNKFSPTVLVIPMTSEIKKVNMPTHNIMHKTKFNGLDEDSMLLGEQTTVIDKKRILYKRGSLVTENEKRSVMEVFFANATGKKTGIWVCINTRRKH